MRPVWSRLLTYLDEQLALACRARRPARPALLAFMFHVLFEDVTALARNRTVDPQQRITVPVLAELVAYFLARDYRFVTPADVLRGLDPVGRYALLTFDDGYYNNRLALPILHHYGVPATFFISTHHVLHNRAFWWDVVYRGRQRHPLPAAAQHAEHAYLLRLGHEDVDQYLLTRFGPGALQPVGDQDRPFTAAELSDFARVPGVGLGNHTAHHAVLTNYAPAAAEHELALGQRHLRQLSGEAPPIAVAYPNGSVSAAVVSAAGRAGLRLGTTVQAGKNYLPFATHGVDVMQLNRFLLWGDRDVERQCRLFETDFHLKQQLRAMLSQP